MSGSETLTQGPNEATPGSGESPAALLNTMPPKTLEAFADQGVISSNEFAASWQQLDNIVSAALYR